ncbi:DUF58 domain-containing protein [Mangrovicella endophytica]|uniref:DUF58 domain-containing protein n=1 Tax=Mangrovicella endophytica TaxID=2066697 RepID=UPI000C9E6142|nr:DUF58 domain-containing protein [Mangrovicella endophytica]
MIRPSRRLLLVAALVTAASVAVVVTPYLPPQTLFLPWGMLLAAMVLDWSISPGSRRLQLGEPGSREIFAGESAHLTFALSRADGARARSAEARIGWPEGIEGPDAFSFRPDPVAGPKAGAATAEITVRAVRRGLHPLSEIAILRPSRLGLLDLLSSHTLESIVRVVPNMRAITSGEVDLHIAAATFGSKTAATRGEGAEFHQLRDFVSGMDARAIDYKRSARHGALLVREMRAEQNHSIVLALDNGHLMREEIDGLPKIDHMLAAALALGWAALGGGDLVGLYAFDARPRLFLPPDRGRRTFAQLRSRTAELEYRSVESNPTLALSHLQTQLRRRSLVVLFADFVDTTTAELLVENVAVIRRHHLVVFVSIADPLLGTYLARPSQRLGDVAETVVAADLQAERRHVLDRLRRLGVHVVEAAPGQLVAPLLTTYLAVKARGLL